MNNTVLTVREKEVIYFISKGYSNSKIAAILNISEHTVKAHISSIIRKIGGENRLDICLKAIVHNIVKLDPKDFPISPKTY